MTELPKKEFRILVVDDESMVRHFVRLILERSGFQVVEAEKGDEALQILQAMSAPPDLLLTDIVMPGLNGLALAAKAHKLCPNLHVLFMSGFSQDYEEDLTGSVCLSKPFKPAELIAAVGAALTPRSETTRPEG